MKCSLDCRFSNVLLRCRDTSGKMSFFLPIAIVNARVCVCQSLIYRMIWVCGECLLRYICTKWLLRQRSRSVQVASSIGISFSASFHSVRFGFRWSFSTFSISKSFDSLLHWYLFLNIFDISTSTQTQVLFVTFTISMSS